ncbi:phosphopantetheine-binding protein, partial [Streptomyces sp. NPDC059814]|uniref:phosphopantetheine-binding protein n=1 Tax=Streptomyces sp. NPDC059814 TaxID=3346959 RepID=UPI00365DCC92
VAVGDDLRVPEYWVRQVREPVRYGDAVATMHDQGVRTFLEIGPGGTLAALAAQSVPDQDTTTAALVSVRPGHSEPESVVRALGELHSRGVHVDWEAFFAGSGARRVPLPAYPFQYRSYWLDPARSVNGTPGPAPTAPREREPDVPEAALALPARLADLTGAQRAPYVLETVTALVAAVLKHPDPSGIASDKPFQELGLDSLTGVELRNRLARSTGLSLPVTVVFDHPSPAALAGHVLSVATAEIEKSAAPADPSAALRAGLAQVEASIGALPDGDAFRSEAATRLHGLLDLLSDPGEAYSTAAPDGAEVRDLIAASSTDEIFDFIDSQLGRVAD